LTSVGFIDLRWHRHGESEREGFRGLERHETYVDTPDLPHVLVVEATRGAATPDDDDARDTLALVDREFLADVRPLSWRIDPARSVIVARLPLRGPLAPLVREHVVRAAWVGGAAWFFPEARETATAEIGIGARHLLVDEPMQRVFYGLRVLPERLRRSIARRLLGPRFLDTGGDDPRITANVARWEPGGRAHVLAELQIAKRRVPLALPVDLRPDGDGWRASASLQLACAELGLPRWRWAGLLAD